MPKWTSAARFGARRSIASIVAYHASPSTSGGGGGGRVVEMDMAEQDVAEVAERKPVVFETALQRVHATRRAAVEQRRPFLGLDDVHADHALDAAVEEIDRAVNGHGALEATPACA